MAAAARCLYRFAPFAPSVRLREHPFSGFLAQAQNCKEVMAGTPTTSEAPATSVGPTTAAAWAAASANTPCLPKSPFVRRLLEKSYLRRCQRWNHSLQFDMRRLVLRLLALVCKQTLLEQQLLCNRDLPRWRILAPATRLSARRPPCLTSSAVRVQTRGARSQLVLLRRASCRLAPAMQRPRYRQHTMCHKKRICYMAAASARRVWRQHRRKSS